jgi:hypothetical protein
MTSVLLRRLIGSVRQVQGSNPMLDRWVIAFAEYIGYISG